MARYQWPGDRDPNVVDDARGRGESFFDQIASVPGAILAEASAIRAALLAAMQAAADENVWLPIGPSITLRGQAGSEPRVTGRVRDLAISDDGNRIYAATANGGVWYSADVGTTWSPLGADASTPLGEAAAPGPSTLVTTCLSVKFGAATSGAQDIVYVGTGELQPGTRGYPGGKASGIGVLKLSRPLPAALAEPQVNPWRREAKNLAGTGIYAIAQDPANADTLIAATSTGLWRRQGAFVEDANWVRVTAGPFDFDADDDKWCTDVVWAPAVGGTPSRLWVALVDDTLFSDTNVWVSEGGVNGPYTEIDLSGRDRDGRLGISVHRKDPSILYVLGKGPRLWRIDGKTARKVQNIPPMLFGSTPEKDQSHYDLAVSAHPDKPDEVIIGGSAILSERTPKIVNGKTTYENGLWSACLYRLTITGTPGDGEFGCNFDQTLKEFPSIDENTYIGNNVHADVHVVRYTGNPAGAHVWVGCDGGIYRSAQGGGAYTFIARNNGLAVVEAGYIASHPTSDGPIIIGTQDNGAIRRVGNTVWRHWAEGGGDGGGVAYHPTLPAYHIAQYTAARWNSNGRWVPPVWRSASSEDSKKDENKVAAFYSDLHVIPGSAANQARVALGTNRLWISEDWNPSAGAPDMTWQTLPSGPGKDPRLNGGNNTDRDAFDSDFDSVRVVQWAGPPGHLEDRIIVLCARAVIAFNRNAATGKWAKSVISRYEEKCGDDEMDNDEIGETTSDVLPARGSWSDLAIHDPARGTHGSLYVAATGYAEFDDDTLVDFTRMDTLWWFDGTGTWHPTRLRGNTGATRAPAFAVAVDPDDIGVVYVGTSAGVWKGALTFSNGAPTWAWTIFSNGLPDAYVQDLVFFKNGNVKLLRAAMQARGVWEVDLGAAPSPRRTYLRAHAFDTRRRFPTDLTNPNSTSVPPANFEWNESPDIVLRPGPTAAPPSSRPSSLPWNPTRQGHSYDIWTLQTAMHRDDPLVRPTGIWTRQLEARIKAFRKNSVTLPELPTAVVDNDFWDEAVVAGKVYADPWDGAEPTEADLAELVESRVLVRNRVLQMRLFSLPYSVHVMVHHRHFEPVPAGDAQVFLLRREIADAEGDGAAVALSPAWKNAVVSSMTGTPAVLPDGWEVVGRRFTTAPLSATTPRPVSFDLDFSADPPFPDETSWMLLAITSSGADAVGVASLNGGTIRDLVLNSHHVAARLVRKSI